MRLARVRSLTKKAAGGLPATVLAGAAAIAAAVPVLGALADTPPPSLPMTLYGNAPGAVPGQRVLAMVTDGANVEVCSDDPNYDMALTFDGRVVYRVSVLSDQTKKGCGAPGRQVVLYFAPSASADGKAATAPIAWQGSGGQGTVVEQNVTLTGPMTNRGYAPTAARDGTY